VKSKSTSWHFPLNFWLMSKLSNIQAPLLKVLWGALVFTLAVSTGATIRSQAADKQGRKARASKRPAQSRRVVPAQRRVPTQPPARGKMSSRGGAMPTGQSTFKGVVLPPGSPDYPPPVAREFRAAWITSVWNQDWPSRTGLSAAQQQAEAIRILDRAQQLKLNALLFQVRPMGDALWASPREPWSQFLMGNVGADPGYDPLQFWTEEAHRRGLELHAWFNPYRVGSVSTLSYPAQHISRVRPEWVLSYGKSRWLDPGQPGVNRYVRGVVEEVVRLYDIDGVHFDDYFYPYSEKDPAGKPIPFPDAASYRKYLNSGGRLSLADWRRDNVNTLVRDTYRDVKRLKSWVKFGISPFGIWKSGYPAGIRGMSAVDEIYADSRRWLQEGWVDYLTPQLYWPISAPAQSYPVLLKWWSEQNTGKRHLWPGHAVHRIGRPEYTAAEIINQVRMTRAQASTASLSSGGVLFGWSTVMQNKGGIAGALQNTWQTPALVPPSPWLDARAPVAPRLQSTFDGTSGALNVSWEGGDREKPHLWILQTQTGGSWNTQILSGATVETQIVAAAGYWPQSLALSAVDRCGNQSVPVVVRLGT
jgi:uncharacterized lipoprotein YddW (UPF0748 family)